MENSLEVKKTNDELVAKLADKLEVKNAEDIVTFGVDAQRKVSSFSDTALQKIKTKDLDETGALITDLLKELNKMGEEPKGFFGFFKRKVNDLKAMKTQYESINTNISAIVKNLEDHQVRLKGDMKVLDDLYNMNSNYLNELDLYIAVGEKKIDELKSNDLKQLAEIADKTKDMADAQKLKDMDNLIVRLEKRVYDLELTRTVAMQMAPQIKMIQNANSTMVEKLNSTITNTIPAWKTQILIAIGLNHLEKSEETSEIINRFTNKMMTVNSEKTKEASKKVQEQSESGLVDIETLKNTNRNIIETIQSVQEIQKVGRENRIAAKKELEMLNKELIDRLKELAVANVQEVINRGKEYKSITGDVNYEEEAKNWRSDDASEV